MCLACGAPPACLGAIPPARTFYRARQSLPVPPTCPGSVRTKIGQFTGKRTKPTPQAWAGLAGLAELAELAELACALATA
eukprot:5056784-Karenia_brevis.AAC.1